MSYKLNSVQSTKRKITILLTKQYLLQYSLGIEHDVERAVRMIGQKSCDQIYNTLSVVHSNDGMMG